MSEHDTPTADLIGYEALCEEALRGVIPAALRQFLNGPPGAHHLYITFRTDRQDVSLPPELLARWPEEMTVIIQHQYFDLQVGEHSFAVKMSFSGITKAMMIGYGAISRIYDPSVQFLIQWKVAAPQTVAEAVRDAVLGPQKAPRPPGVVDTSPRILVKDDPAVVDFAAFRGKGRKP